MSRNGNGTYNLPAGNPVSSGSVITSTWANTTLSDIAVALTGSVAADGQTPVTGNLNMAGNKVSNLGAGTLATDAANLAQVTSSVAITGGNINGTPIGQSTAAAGSFTALSATGNGTVGGDLTVTGSGTFGTNGAFNGTGSLRVPTGTLAQRNSNILGLLRFNTTYGNFEGCVAVTAGATISTITRVSTLATLTTSTDHGLKTGDFVTVSGAIPVEFNGTYEIIVTAVNTFTYVMASTPSANATTMGSYVVGTWSATGSGATGGGNNQVFVLNDQTVTNDYTIPIGKNASSAGPITVDTGITVTIPTDSTWVIV
jgi:hypothetical protein